MRPPPHRRCVLPQELAEGWLVVWGAGLRVHPWDLTTGWTEVLLDRHSPWWVGRCTSSDLSASGTWDLLVQTLNPFWRVLLWAMRAWSCNEPVFPMIRQPATVQQTELPQD